MLDMNEKGIVVTFYSAIELRWILCTENVAFKSTVKVTIDNIRKSTNLLRAHIHAFALTNRLLAFKQRLTTFTSRFYL